MTKNTQNNDTSDEIDANLRRVYEKVLNEDLPDRFLDLLNRLKAEDATDTPPALDRGDD